MWYLIEFVIYRFSDIEEPVNGFLWVYRLSRLDHRIPEAETVHNMCILVWFGRIRDLLVFILENFD